MKIQRNVFFKCAELNETEKNEKRTIQLSDPHEYFRQILQISKEYIILSLQNILKRTGKEKEQQ